MAVTIKKKAGKTVAEHLVGEPAMATTKTTTKTAGKITSEKQTEEMVAPLGVIAPDKLCVVGVRLSSTVNLGDYNSVKIEVSLSVPTEKGEISDAYEFASDWVSEKVNAVATQFKEQIA